MITGTYIIINFKNIYFFSINVHVFDNYILGSLRNRSTVREGMARSRKSMAGSQRGLCLGQHCQGKWNGPPPRGTSPDQVGPWWRCTGGG